VFDPGGHNPGAGGIRRAVRLSHRTSSPSHAYSICAPRTRQRACDLQALTRFLRWASATGMLALHAIGERVTWGMYNNDTPTEAQKDDLYRVARWAGERAWR